MNATPTRRLLGSCSALLAGAMCLSATVLATAAHAQGTTEIVFASGPDDTGTVQRLVDAFNASHEGSIRVTWRQMARESDAHHDQVVKELASKAGDVDLIASDVVWTAELAKKRWVVDLTRRFYDDFDRDAFLTPARESATYRLRMWGVPWYTDAGMLFYRKDKLASSGFSAAPATWDELGTMAKKVMSDTGTKYGFVFQGAEYEGGTVNAAEYVWSAGGEVVTPQLTVTGLVVNTVTETDAVRINTPEAARGFDIARGFIADGVSPAEVVDFREKEALDAFAAGDAVFLRSWPYAFGVLRERGLGADQIGVAALPAASGGRNASCLGGWNLMINASSSRAERNAAWTLIRYLTDSNQQKRQALEAGLLPVLEGLYDDPDLIRDVPAVGLGKQVFMSQLHSRPESPVYYAMSDSISRVFNQSLKGELTGAEAVEVLERELQASAMRNR